METLVRSRASRRRGRAFLSLALLLTVALPATAQEVRFGARPRRPAEVRLDSTLVRGGYRLWTADTVLAREGKVTGDVVILEAAVRLEGEIRGDVFVVDGALFLRPGSVVRGDVIVLGGGFYSSRLATVEGRVDFRPERRYRVQPRKGGWEITPVRPHRPGFELHGLSGVKMPAYDRVSSVTVAVGATGRLRSWPGRPSLEVVGRFRTASGELDGTLRQEWHPSDAWRIGVEAERTIRTNDDWLKNTTSNSLSYLLVGEDFRNYYRSDRVALLTALSTASGWAASFAVQWEKARSRSARDLFSLFGDDDVRPNPPVTEGETWSVIVGAGVAKRTVASKLEAGFRLEAADSSVAGDFSFWMGEVRGRWERPGLAEHHRVELFVLGRADLAGTPPEQRWSGVGGRTTLPTLAILDRRGPRLLFGRLTYLVPLRALDVGPLGVPGMFVRAAVGSAWHRGESVSPDVNLLTGARLSVLEVAFAVDPGEGDLDPTFIAVLRLPGDL